MEILQTGYYACWRESRTEPGVFRYTFFYRNPKSVVFSMGGRSRITDPVHEVRLTEWIPGTGIPQPEPSYWGWHRTGQNHFSMIWPTYIQLKVCLPAAIGDYVANGTGRPVILAVEKINDVDVSSL